MVLGFCCYDSGSSGRACSLVFTMLYLCTIMLIVYDYDLSIAWSVLVASC